MTATIGLNGVATDPGSPTITVADHPLTAEILPPEAQEFLAGLHRQFEPGRQAALASHRDRIARTRAGERPSFPAESAHIRTGEWHVAPAPADLTDRRTELTGPVRRDAMIEALTSGAKVFMADFEDVTAPTWHNCLDGQRNLRDAYAGTLTAAVGGEVEAPPADRATLVVRTRGWHLTERHFTVDGELISASLFDFGLCAFHGAHAAVAAGSGPYFYLPKVEGATDAALWRRVFEWSEDHLDLPRGTIRATVLIETIHAAFEMDEILFELRDHVTGLHTGNWDYLFSITKAFHDDPSFVLPDRADLRATTPFIRAFTELLVSVCHRRGAHAIGGMSGVIPDPIDPARTAPALRKVTVDKRREAGDGFDGTRIAHPALVAAAEAEFDRVLSYRPNQLEFQRDDVYVTAGDLLAVASTSGRRTEEGLRRNIGIALHYLGEWLAGNGAVAIDDHLEDTAMAEVCRTQVWQWRRHGVVLSNGLEVDDALIERLIREEFDALRDALGPDAWARGRFDDSRRVLTDVILADELTEFLTEAAYESL